MRRLEEVKRKLLEREDLLRDLEALGVCGSLARGEFSQRSDIDIFVVIREEDDREGVDEVGEGFLKRLEQMAAGTKEAAPWHGWSVYGRRGERNGFQPSNSAMKKRRQGCLSWPEEASRQPRNSCMDGLGSKASRGGKFRYHTKDW